MQEVKPAVHHGATILNFRERVTYMSETGTGIVWALQDSGEWRAYQQIPGVNMFADRKDLDAKDDEHLWEQLQGFRQRNSTES